MHVSGFAHDFKAKKVSYVEQGKLLHLRRMFLQACDVIVYKLAYFITKQFIIPDDNDFIAIMKVRKYTIIL